MTTIDLVTDLTTAADEWARGLLVPARITAALDMCDLYGPEVDERCGVTEPAVDWWEEGRLYPTWDQLVRLAALTGFAEHWFTREPADYERTATPLDTTLRFHIPAKDLERWLAEPLPLLAFPPDVVAACDGTSPDVAEIERRAGYRLPSEPLQLSLPI